jgi:hypothetical protein
LAVVSGTPNSAAIASASGLLEFPERIFMDYRAERRE